MRSLSMIGGRDSLCASLNIAVSYGEELEYESGVKLAEKSMDSSKIFHRW